MRRASRVITVTVVMAKVQFKVTLPGVGRGGAGADQQL